MRFIELHLLNGSPILVFIQNILTIHKNLEEPHTKIFVQNTAEAILVQETPDEIKIKIHG